MELFYDLVFVVLIAQVAHSLAGHPDVKGFATYAFLFTMVWWVWANGTMYHDLHGSDDIRTRFFTFLQMIAVGAMAAFAHHAIGETSIPFALSYAALHAILTYLWWSSGRHNPEHRVLSTPWAITFSFTTLLILISVFVPEPYRYWLWGASIAIDLALPIVQNLTMSDAAREEQQRIDFVTHSLTERFGLFTIIVLGEIMVGAIATLSEHETVTPASVALFVLAMLFGIGLWWLYFDALGLRKPVKGQRSTWTWLFAHLLVAMGIAAVGAAISSIAEYGTDPHHAHDIAWILIASVVTTLLGVAALIWVRDDAEGERSTAEITLVLGAAALSVVVGFLLQPSFGFFGALVALVSIPPAVRLIALSRQPDA